MVWFQCEDCGENLKKPKLQSHFRICSGRKLSCIDCGVVFNQQSVQSHTQCVSEAEKYGPKGIGCATETPKVCPKEHNLNLAGIDINLGLSTRAPWNCSLCNVKATSQETLILHSQGKKHRSKAKAVSNKSPLTSEREFVSHDTAAINGPVTSGLVEKSFDLTKEENKVAEFEFTGSAEKIFDRNGEVRQLEKFFDRNGEVRQLVKKENSTQVEHCKKDHKAKANGVKVDPNATTFSQVCSKDGESCDQEVRRKRKRQIGDNYVKEEGVEDSSREKEIIGEQFRNTRQEKSKDISSVFCGSEGQNFAGVPPEIVLDENLKKPKRSRKNGKHRVSSSQKAESKSNGLVEPPEHEQSDVSWEQLNDGSDVMQNIKERSTAVGRGQLLVGKQALYSSCESWSGLVKWEKLIKRSLNDCGGSLTRKKLCKCLLPLVMKTIETSGLSIDKESFRKELDRQIHSYRNLLVEGKNVRLVINDNARSS